MPRPMIVQTFPTRRSTSTAYVGRLSNWSGTPRQMKELADWARDDERRAESRWFRVLFVLMCGIVIGMQLPRGPL